MNTYDEDEMEMDMDEEVSPNEDELEMDMDEDEEELVIEDEELVLEPKGEEKEVPKVDLTPTEDLSNQVEIKATTAESLAGSYEELPNEDEEEEMTLDNGEEIEHMDFTSNISLTSSLEDYEEEMTLDDEDPNEEDEELEIVEDSAISYDIESFILDEDDEDDFDELERELDKDLTPEQVYDRWYNGKDRLEFIESIRARNIIDNPKDRTRKETKAEIINKIELDHQLTTGTILDMLVPKFVMKHIDSISKHDLLEDEESIYKKCEEICSLDIMKDRNNIGKKIAEYIIVNTDYEVTEETSYSLFDILNEDDLDIVKSLFTIYLSEKQLSELTNQGMVKKDYDHEEYRKRMGMYKTKPNSFAYIEEYNHLNNMVTCSECSHSFETISGMYDMYVMLNSDAKQVGNLMLYSPTCPNCGCSLIFTNQQCKELTESDGVKDFIRMVGQSDYVDILNSIRLMTRTSFIRCKLPVSDLPKSINDVLLNVEFNGVSDKVESLTDEELAKAIERYRKKVKLFSVTRRKSHEQVNKEVATTSIEEDIEEPIDVTINLTIDKIGSATSRGIGDVIRLTKYLCKMVSLDYENELSKAQRALVTFLTETGIADRISSITELERLAKVDSINLLTNGMFDTSDRVGIAREFGILSDGSIESIIDDIKESYESLKNNRQMHINNLKKYKDLLCLLPISNYGLKDKEKSVLIELITDAQLRDFIEEICHRIVLNSNYKEILTYLSCSTQNKDVKRLINNVVFKYANLDTKTTNKKGGSEKVGKYKLHETATKLFDEMNTGVKVIDNDKINLTKVDVMDIASLSYMYKLRTAYNDKGNVENAIAQVVKNCDYEKMKSLDFMYEVGQLIDDIKDGINEKDIIGVEVVPILFTSVNSIGDVDSFRLMADLSEIFSRISINVISDKFNFNKMFLTRYGSENYKTVQPLTNEEIEMWYVINLAINDAEVIDTDIAGNLTDVVEMFKQRFATVELGNINKFKEDNKHLGNSMVLLEKYLTKYNK